MVLNTVLPKITMRSCFICRKNEKAVCAIALPLIFHIKKAPSFGGAFFMLYGEKFILLKCFFLLFDPV